MRLQLPPGDCVPLGDGWELWPVVAVRAAGFAVELLEEFGNMGLASSADAMTASGDQRSDVFDAAYDQAVGDLSTAVRRLARDDVFRQAVAWQNLEVVKNCLDPLTTGSATRTSSHRRREEVAAAYLQRYTMKNDSIGHFGPVGWARLDDSVRRMAVLPGESLIRRRRVYFESWAMDALGDAFLERPGVAGGLRPRPPAGLKVTGRIVHFPVTSTIQLSHDEATLLALCDGKRTVDDVLGQAAHDSSEVTTSRMRLLLASLVARGVILLNLQGPFETHPEESLRAKLLDLPDIAAREECLVILDGFTEKKAELGRATRADEVGRIMGELEAAFRAEAGRSVSATRSGSRSARTLVYQDCTRDATSKIGPVLLQELFEPLRLVLHSARWLTREAARSYLDLFDRLFEQQVVGPHPVPLMDLLLQVFPTGTSVPRDLHPHAATLAEEFRARWTRALSGPDGAIVTDWTAAELSGRVNAEFCSARSNSWSAARHHSPDVLLASPSLDALERGDYLAVVGEVHVACNSLESPLFVEQNDTGVDLLALAERDHTDQRIYAIEPKASPYVSSRLLPPAALLSPRYTYWSWAEGEDSARPPGVMPAAGMVVSRERGQLVVHGPEGQGPLDLIEVIGELMSEVVVNLLRVRTSDRHQPRITIDKLVMTRESWTFPVGELGWVFGTVEKSRYISARQWSGTHGLPDEVFVKIRSELKPVYIDLSTLVGVNLFARFVRAAGKAGQDELVVVTEALPNRANTWFPDAVGGSYSSEFRFVAVDRSHVGGPHTGEGRPTASDEVAFERDGDRYE